MNFLKKNYEEIWDYLLKNCKYGENCVENGFKSSTEKVFRNVSSKQVTKKLKSLAFIGAFPRNQEIIFWKFWKNFCDLFSLKFWKICEEI